MTRDSRLLVGNLDHEDRLAPPDPSALGGRVRRALAALGTLMRVFARPGDRLWTDGAVAPERMADVEGLPRPQLIHGPAAWRRPQGQVLAWGESDPVAALRGAMPTVAPIATGVPLHEFVWRGPFPEPGAPRRASHRGLQLEVARDLEVALPGARLLKDADALHAHLASDGAAAAPEGRWVLKAPFSAAGRDRLRGVGRGPLAPSDATRAARLFARHRELLFEPWMERLADFGAIGWIDHDGPRVLGIHRQDLDGYGRFRALTVVPKDASVALGLDTAEATALGASMMGAGQRIAAVGYRGAFGVDAWRYRDAAHRTRFHPLGEINARFTFGFLIHALVARLEDAGLPIGTLRFQLGRGPSETSGTVRDSLVVPLVLPAANDPTRAWIEVSRRPVTGPTSEVS